MLGGRGGPHALSAMHVANAARAKAAPLRRYCLSSMPVRRLLLRFMSFSLTGLKPPANPACAGSPAAAYRFLRTSCADHASTGVRPRPETAASRWLRNTCPGTAPAGSVAENCGYGRRGRLERRQVHRGSPPRLPHTDRYHIGSRSRRREDADAVRRRELGYQNRVRRHRLGQPQAGGRRSGGGHELVEAGRRDRDDEPPGAGL